MPNCQTHNNQNKHIETIATLFALCGVNVNVSAQNQYTLHCHQNEVHAIVEHEIHQWLWIKSNAYNCLHFCYFSWIDYGYGYRCTKHTSRLVHFTVKLCLPFPHFYRHTLNIIHKHKHIILEKVSKIHNRLTK